MSPCVIQNPPCCPPTSCIVRSGQVAAFGNSHGRPLMPWWLPGRIIFLTFSLPFLPTSFLLLGFLVPTAPRAARI